MHEQLTGSHANIPASATHLLAEVWYPWGSQERFDRWFKWNLLWNRQLCVMDVDFLACQQLMTVIEQGQGIDALFQDRSLVPMLRTNEVGQPVHSLSELAQRFVSNAGFFWGPGGQPTERYLKRLDSAAANRLWTTDLIARRGEYGRLINWVLSRWATGHEPYGRELQKLFQKDNNAALAWASDLAHSRDFRRSTIYHAIRSEHALERFVPPSRVERANRLLQRIADEVYLHVNVKSMGLPAAYPPGLDSPLWLDEGSEQEGAQATVPADVVERIEAIEAAIPIALGPVYSRVAKLSFDQILDLRAAAQDYWKKLDDVSRDARLQYYENTDDHKDMACAAADQIRRIASAVGIKMGKGAPRGRYVLRWGVHVVPGCAAFAAGLGIWMSAGAGVTASMLCHALLSSTHRIGDDAIACRIWKAFQKTSPGKNAHYAHHVRLPRANRTTSTEWAFFDRWSGAISSEATDASTSVDDIVYGADHS